MEFESRSRRMVGWVLVSALALALGTGCVRRRIESRDEGPLRPREPGITVTTHGRGPVTYGVTSTNTPDGVKVFRFVPNR